jgi:hypothetical protein
MGMLDDHVLDVPCETCGRDIKVKAGALRKSPTLTCSCGQSITADASRFDSSLSEVDAAEKRLDDSIKRLGGTIGG